MNPARGDRDCGGGCLVQDAESSGEVVTLVVNCGNGDTSASVIDVRRAEGNNLNSHSPDLELSGSSWVMAKMIIR
jgi:hypothetical protein